MQTKQLKNTDLNASEICMGLSQLGIDSPIPEAEDILDRFLDIGGNFLDTARCYSDWIPGEKGRSERILGDYLKKRKNRDKFVICSKGAHPEIEVGEVMRVCPEAINHDIDLSLKVLGTDRIDIYLLHRDDPTVPVGVLLDALECARKLGKILEYGVSNWSPERIGDLIEAAEYHGIRGIRIDQEMINFGSMNHLPLPNKTMKVWELGHADVIRRADCAVMAFSAQSGGFFHRICSGGIPEKENSIYSTPENIRRAKVLKQLVAESGLSVSALLLLYLLQAKTLQIFPVVRCQNLSELSGIIEAMAHRDDPIDFKSLRDFE